MAPIKRPEEIILGGLLVPGTWGSLVVPALCSEDWSSLGPLSRISAELHSPNAHAFLKMPQYEYTPASHKSQCCQKEHQTLPGQKVDF